MRYYSALNEAIKAHEGQTRKLEGTIYVAHPIEVGFILSEYNLRYEVIIAGILHDTVEDTYMTYEMLTEMFGGNVSDLVRGASEQDKSLPWQTRKELAIAYLNNDASLEEKYIICADRLSNIRSFYRVLITENDPKNSDLWDKFNAGYEKQKWYFQETINGLKELKGIGMYDELIDIHNKIFN